MSVTQDPSRGQIVGQKAPDFALKDQDGNVVALHQLLEKGPLMLVFYPNDFTAVCTKQLCNYRDNVDTFRDLGIQIVGVSTNSAAEHLAFREKYQLPFPLLTDPGHQVAIQYGCRSPLMMGGVSRAVVIISRKQMILYRYVEPTVFTRRKADQLLGVLNDLKSHSLI